MIFIVLYSFGLLFSCIIWWRIKLPKYTNNSERVTAIIVVRNEESGIRVLLESLERQTYKNLEVIIVDDASEDRTVDIIKEFSFVKLLHLTPEERGTSPKKNGIEKAIKEATGSIIFSTDGDCIVPPNLIDKCAGYFTNKAVQFISGPVTFKQEKKIWNQVQVVEFASLVGSAAISIYFHSPIMSSAANMCYRKEAFFAVNGYQGNFSSASGDDEFLMTKISQQFSKGVIFAKDANCIIETDSSANLKTFYHQRKRWAGKWSVSTNLATQWVAIFIFFVNALSLYAAFTGQWAILIFRFLCELLFLSSVLSFLNRRSSIWYIPFTQILYSFYVVFFGLISLISSKYNWKGRELK